MKMALKLLMQVLLLLIMVVACLWHFGPYEPVDLEVGFDESVLGSDVDAYFAAREARFSDIRPGHQKRVVWFGERGVKTPQVLVYVHGFSASAQELRPVPDLMADALGANLVYMRLAGHGRSGEAMATATAQAWMADLAEALAVARQVGDEVILISTSTGGTLVALAALQPELMRQVKGVIFVSPNFAIGDPLAPLLNVPAARYWLPLVAGRTWSFEPRNDLQKQFWTTSYPSIAILPVAALVKEVWQQDWTQVGLPALFWYSDADTVVRPAATDTMAARWGGDVSVVKVVLGEGDDPNSHVVAGAILSPSQTDKTVSNMVRWIDTL